MTPKRAKRPDPPPPLTVAVSVVALEALGYGLFGLTEWAVTDRDNPVVGISTGLFFVLFAGFLGFCAWRLWRLQSWARAPIVMTQLIQVPVAVSFWGSGWTNSVTVGLVVLSLVTLAGIFHPESLEALETEGT